MSRGTEVPEHYRLCILDCSNRVNVIEGDLLSAMVHQLPNVSTDVYAVRYNHWPGSNEKLSLDLIDEQLMPYRTKEAPLLPNSCFPVTIVKHNYETPTVETIANMIEKKYHGIIISGSADCCMDDSLPFVPVLMNLIREVVVKRDIPTWGICFGAQAIARAIYGNVKTMLEVNKHPENGITRVYLNSDHHNKLFENVPTEFVTTMSHCDCFIVNEDLRLARTDLWENEAYQVKDRYTWGVQFHPEFTKEAAEVMFNRVKQRFGDSVEIVHDAQSPNSTLGKTMTRNFIHAISEQVYKHQMDEEQMDEE
jgi:GMP synthase-like glutamine amidotransferase